MLFRTLYSDYYYYYFKKMINFYPTQKQALAPEKYHFFYFDIEMLSDVIIKY